MTNRTMPDRVSGTEDEGAKTILDKLYYGELYPMEHTDHDEAYWALNRVLSEKKQEWENRLSEEELQQWQELANLETDFMCMELRSMFRCGFRLGCGLFAEIYDGWPLDKTS